jgi:hypothetical protein
MKDSLRQIKSFKENISVKKVELGKAENLNTVFCQEGSNGILQLIQGASEYAEPKELGFVHSILPLTPVLQLLEQTPLLIQEPRVELEIVHENKILLRRGRVSFAILGALSQDLSSMRVTLMIEEHVLGRKERTKIDLYERELLSNLAFRVSEMFDQEASVIERDLLLLTDLLEKHRENQLLISKPDYISQRQHSLMSNEQEKHCIEFLKQPDLIRRIDEQIEKAGVVGEENTRKLLFVIASTFKMSTPLHALVQGSSGSGKSHLINGIGQCLPPEDVMSMTRVTSKSFYHYSRNQLVDKLLLIQDFDGLDEEAQYAFRELQSAGNISSSTTYKDRSGNLVSAIKNVRSHFASLVATTKGEVYYDNMSRSVIIGVDESEEQTLKIMSYQNKQLAGLIEAGEEKRARVFLQNCIRSIKPYEVLNPYADKIKLPLEAKMLRRLNSHYQAFVKQITILHQHQRPKDSQGRLIAEPQDLKMACSILFDAIMLKVDDLDSSLRQFFDRMKNYVQELAHKSKKPLTEAVFTQRDVRLCLRVSKSQCFRFMEDLELLEYVQRTGGYANRGFKYKIVFWDNIETLRERIKSDLEKQLANLGRE